jgi:hypothetical protein
MEMAVDNKRIPVAVLGATGAVGQRFVQLLDQHPWFEVVGLTGSDRAVGQLYVEACHWILPESMPGWARRLVVLPTLPVPVDVPLVFSALPSGAALRAEPAYAQAGSVVCSNASAFRDEPDVPLLLPEVNPDHTALVHRQRRERSFRGFIVTNPNCTSTGMTSRLRHFKTLTACKGLWFPCRRSPEQDIGVPAGYPQQCYSLHCRGRGKSGAGAAQDVGRAAAGSDRPGGPYDFGADQLWRGRWPYGLRR